MLQRRLICGLTSARFIRVKMGYLYFSDCNLLNDFVHFEKLKFLWKLIRLPKFPVAPCPPEVSFVTRPPKGGYCNPLPGFSIRNAWYPSMCYQCMDFLYPLMPKWVPLIFISRHCDVIKSACPRKFGYIEHIRENEQKSIFRYKSIETWDFRTIFGWICKEMMILIYIASLKHIYFKIFKKWAK